MREIEKIIADHKDCFISSLLSTIYDYIEEPDEETISTFLKEILSHNQEVYNKLKSDHEKLKSKISKLKNLEPEVEEPIKTQSLEIKPLLIKQNTNLDELCYKIYSCESKEELNILLSNIDNNLLPNILLFLTKEINQLIIEIRQSIMKNPTLNISFKQKELLRLQNLFNSIKFYKRESNQSIHDTKPNIFFLTNNSNTAYFYETLLNNLEGDSKVKKSLDKMLSGYFIHSHDVKNIIRNNKKILEYKDSNGTRILFEDLGNNNYLICDFFFKNKQISSKITNYYELNIERYLNNKEKIQSLLNDPNYYIEQAEILGSIYCLLEQNQLLEKSDSHGK